MDSDIANSVISGVNSQALNITSTRNGKTITLGDSGIGAKWGSGQTNATYSAIQVNAKGIAIAGGQILDVIDYGQTPNIVAGGWYFEENPESS